MCKSSILSLSLSTFTSHMIWKHVRSSSSARWLAQPNLPTAICLMMSRLRNESLVHYQTEEVRGHIGPLDHVGY